MPARGFTGEPVPQLPNLLDTFCRREGARVTESAPVIYFPSDNVQATKQVPFEELLAYCVQHLPELDPDHVEEHLAWLTIGDARVEQTRLSKRLKEAQERKHAKQ